MEELNKLKLWNICLTDGNILSGYKYESFTNTLNLYKNKILNIFITLKTGKKIFSHNHREIPFIPVKWWFGINVIGNVFTKEVNKEFIKMTCDYKTETKNFRRIKIIDYENSMIISDKVVDI